MHRIAAAILIAAAAVALNGGLPGQAFARDITLSAAPQTLAAGPVETRSAQVLSLLLVLEALRQTPVVLDKQKV